MYLRFRRFDSKDRTRDQTAFAEVYEMIHGKAAPIEKPKGDVRVQVSLVEAVWIDGKPKQKHIAVLGNLREGDTDLEPVRKKLKELNVGKEHLEKLMSKISEHSAK